MGVSWYTYFEKSNPVSLEVANQTYDKFEDYVIEHYTNSYTGPSAQASVISVNFEKWFVLYFP